MTTEVLTWDVASNLVSSVVDDGSHYDYWTYLYDASGQRWAKIEHPTDVTLPTQATVYLGDTEITDTDTFVNDATPDVTATRFFTFGGSTVATEIATEGAATVPFFFLFGDYQGSAQLMLPDLRDGSGDYDLPESAAHIQRNAYTPYGSQRALNTDTSDDSPDVTVDASLSIERGWLSQVADEATSSLGTGLTYLNARYYDPVASRFISPDPMLDVMDPKTLDPYRYAENNPVSYSDPTGLWSCLSDPTHQGCGGAGAGGAKFGQKDRSGWQAHTDSIVKDQIQHKKRVLRDRMDITTESQWQDIKSTYDSNWEIAKNGLINYGAGFVDAASGTVDFLDQAAVNLYNPGCVLGVWGSTCIEVPDIAKIGIKGDPSLYQWSYLSGEVGFDLATTAATGGSSMSGLLGRNGARVFWAGPGARGAAETLAHAKGGVTRGETILGRAMEKVGINSRFLWDDASRAFALRDRGAVDIVNAINHPDILASTLARVEMPALVSRGVEMIFHAI